MGQHKHPKLYIRSNEPLAIISLRDGNKKIVHQPYPILLTFKTYKINNYGKEYEAFYVMFLF